MSSAAAAPASPPAAAPSAGGGALAPDRIAAAFSRACTTDARAGPASDTSSAPRTMPSSAVAGALASLGLSAAAAAAAAATLAAHDPGGAGRVDASQFARIAQGAWLQRIHV